MGMEQPRHRVALMIKFVSICKNCSNQDIPVRNNFQIPNALKEQKFISCSHLKSIRCCLGAVLTEALWFSTSPDRGQELSESHS